jgi:hypothetical protein
VAAGSGGGAVFVGVDVDVEVATVEADCRGNALAASFLPSSRLTMLGALCFPEKNSAAVKAGMADGAVERGGDVVSAATLPSH